MKILHVGDRAGVAFELATLIQKKGHYSIVLFRPSSDRLGFWKNYKSISQPYFKRFLKFFIHVLKTSKEFDIIHSHIDIIVPFLKILYPNKMIICHFHGSDLRQRSSIRIKCISIFADKIAIATPDLIKYVPKSKTIFIPNIVNNVFFTTKFDKNEKIIFLPINLRKEKNYMFSLESWKILREINKDVKLKIIKFGNDIKKCQDILKNDDRVIWLEPLEKNQMKDEMILSSIVWEQHLVGVFGITGMEAMALGIPVFTYFDEKNNLDRKYVPPVYSTKTPDEQAKLSAMLLDNEELRVKKGKESQNWIKNVHSDEAVFKILKKLYKIQ